MGSRSARAGRAWSGLRGRMRTLSVVDATTAATLGGIAGLALGRRGDGRRAPVGALDGGGAGRRRPTRRCPPASATSSRCCAPAASSSTRPTGSSTTPRPPSRTGWSAARSSCTPSCSTWPAPVRRDGVIREAELDLPKGLGGRPASSSAPASRPSAPTTCCCSSRTAARRRRVEEIRRDFLANVSHELKTPVGGSRLLAEAVLDAHDDPEAVARFAKRMQVESDRLTRLVQEIVELSRLQGADVAQGPAPSSTSAHAPARPSTAAGSSPTSNDIELVTRDRRGLRGLGRRASS